MSAPQSSRISEKESARKRRSHTKSRGGCGNCKLRRVKCDESRPYCKKCRAFGVSCSYDRVSSTLHSFEEVAFSMGDPQSTAVSLNRTVLGALNDSLGRQSPSESPFQLRNRDLEILNRFHDRTVLTIGHSSSRHIFQRVGLALAFQHPFLMHAVLTITLIHDRTDLANSQQSSLELYHWCEATSQFNRKLTDSLTPSERDAIWITSVILGCTTLGQVVGETPEDVWPLNSPSHTDLDWVKLGEGKKAVWRITDPSRPDSVLRPLAAKHHDGFMTRPADQEAFKALPPELVELCGLGEDASPEANPFYTPGAMLGRVMPVEFSDETFLKFMTFMTAMPREFRDLLEAKDHRAILIMAYFVAKMRGPSPWWSGRRLQLECEAMCRYLARFYGHIPHMEKLLEFPRTYLVTTDATPPPTSESTESLSEDDIAGKGSRFLLRA